MVLTPFYGFNVFLKYQRGVRVLQFPCVPKRGEGFIVYIKFELLANSKSLLFKNWLNPQLSLRKHSANFEKLTKNSIYAPMTRVINVVTKYLIIISIFNYLINI